MELIPVHVGSISPEAWSRTEARAAELRPPIAPWVRDRKRPLIARADIDWDSAGLMPHWIQADSVECAAALDPGVYYAQGAEEFTRFRDGAKGRGETALVVSTAGILNEDGTPEPRSLFDGDDSVMLGSVDSYIAGELLPAGGKVGLAADLSEADKDLARRLQNTSSIKRWWRLSLVGPSKEDWGGHRQLPAEGTLVPILETELHEPVAAVWLSPDGVERRYIVPAQTPWPLILDWLMAQALPAYVPEAMRRARRHLSTDVDLMTNRECELHAALAALKSHYRDQESKLSGELASAEQEASSTRDGLLYGTGDQLVAAVRTVLESAGLTVVNLDDVLGGTKNADLLVTSANRSRLVEVKSAGGKATERAYDDLVRHLTAWPHLTDSVPVEGGAFVINHEYKRVPGDRERQPYQRPEFLQAVTEPIVTTLDLFDAWRQEDSHRIRSLFFRTGPDAGQLENADRAASPESPPCSTSQTI